MFSSPLSWIARAAAACAAALTLASCGGGVSANSSPIVDSPTITILPGTAVMYSGMPTTFVLSGGTGAYVVASSNQAILPFSGGVTGRSLTLVPNPVIADTTVTLTVRDTGTAVPVTATITVRPGTVNNDLTITPSPTQSSSCTPAVCSGGDAEVKVTISQGGIPLAARGIRFEAISGSFGFIVSAPGAVPEVLAASVVTTSDETGIARARIRATALAPNQTALVRATDIASGAYRQASFTIAQFTGNTPAFFVVPSTITFTGPYENVCASGASTRVSIFGGTPPYTISGSSSEYSVDTTTVAASGGSFGVSLPLSASPICFKGGAIGVTDATGRTIFVTINNEEGTGTAPAPAIELIPNFFDLACGSSATIVVQGGAEPFSVATNHPRITTSLVGRTVTVSRLTGDGAAPYPNSATIFVTDGTTTGAANARMPVNCP